MIPFQGDPSTLETWGDPWVGIWIPAVILLLSVIVSFWLYRHFVKKGPSA